MAYSKPSELLREIDSHGIYDAKMLDECTFDTTAVPTFTVEQTARNIERRGLGGSVHGSEDDRLIYGYSTAEGLWRQHGTGGDPAAALQGRGSRFRTYLAALEA